MVAFGNLWRFGMACTECNASLIAPNGSEYVSKHEVRDFWFCDSCGHEIEVLVDLRINARSEPSKSIESSVVA